MSAMIHNKNSELVSESNTYLSFALLTDIGDREEQQDCFAYALTPNSGIFIICDGMGGYEGGRLASEIAASSFVTSFLSTDSLSDPIVFLQETAYEVDSKLYRLRTNGRRPLKCGSTCVVLMLVENLLYWCSIGDSRAYLLRDGNYIQFTKDLNYHTVLEEKLNAGLISQVEYQAEGKKGDALISYLGIGNLALIDYNNEPFVLRSGDKLVLITDGLYRVLPEADIAEIVNNFSSPKDAVSVLENKSRMIAAKSGISRDNTTIGIIHFK